MANADESELSFVLEVFATEGTGIYGNFGAHLHCETVTSAVVAFLAGEVAGGMDGDITSSGTLTSTNLNPQAPDQGCGSTIPELVASIQAGKVYINVHSTTNSSGELTGKLSQ